jgi:hypothetical protein
MRQIFAQSMHSLPQAGEDGASVAPQAPASQEPLKERAPQMDCRGTVEEDVRLRGVRLREVRRQQTGAGIHDGAISRPLPSHDPAVCPGYKPLAEILR